MTDKEPIAGIDLGTTNSAIGILEEGFTEQNGLLNSTMKMIRGKITERYQELLDHLYTPEAKEITNPRNREAMKKLLS